MAFLLGWIVAPAVAADATVEFRRAVTGMAERVGALSDCTFVFHQSERHGNKLEAPVRIEVKYRPMHDVYMRWVDGGRQVLFRPGWNDDRLMVDPGPWIPTLSLAPDSRLAMNGQRQGVLMMGFPNVVRLFTADVRRAEQHPEYPVSTVDEGPTNELGEAAHCWAVTLPKKLDPAFYAAKVRVCLADRNALPVRIQAWEEIEGVLTMVEDYGYTDVKINVGLTDRDFEPATYGF